MKKIIETLESFVNQKLELSSRSGVPTIKATQRNQMKKEIEMAFENDLSNLLAETDLIHIVAKTDDGIILAIEHDQLVDNSNTESEICFEINIKIKNLDYNIENAIESYEMDLKEKAETKKEKERAKQEKIERDKKDRAERKRLAELKKATE